MPVSPVTPTPPATTTTSERRREEEREHPEARARHRRRGLRRARARARLARPARPEAEEIGDLHKQTVAVQQQIADDLSRAATARSATSAPTIKTADIYKLETAMPSIADMPDLLLELDQTAKAAGVTLQSIQPRLADRQRERLLDGAHLAERERQLLHAHRPALPAAATSSTSAAARSRRTGAPSRSTRSTLTPNGATQDCRRRSTSTRTCTAGRVGLVARRRPRRLRPGRRPRPRPPRRPDHDDAEHGLGADRAGATP